MCNHCNHHHQSLLLSSSSPQVIILNFSHFIIIICLLSFFLIINIILLNITQIVSLINMLGSDDIGCTKNSCFALSCIASFPQGHTRLLAHPEIDNIIRILSAILSSHDDELVWFSAMWVHAWNLALCKCTQQLINNVLQYNVCRTLCKPPLHVCMCLSTALFEQVKGNYLTSGQCRVGHFMTHYNSYFQVFVSF